MKKILIIEDEKVLSDMYREKLARAGFQTITAPTAKEGLTLSKKQKPDLIILDILLPKENGLFFLEELRKNSKTAKTKVIVFSNYDNPETKEKAGKLKAETYLIKTDFTPKEMVEKVKECLE